MNTEEIENLLRHLAGYTGTFSSNTIPKLKLTSKSKSFICNTDPSYLPGRHWIAMNMYKKGKKNILEVFDSYGTNGKINHSKNWVIKKNKECYQSPKSIVCGEYCVYFIHKRLLGNSFKNILLSLKNSKNSDKLVKKYTLWLKQNIPKKIIFSCKSQYCKTKGKLYYPYNLIIK